MVPSLKTRARLAGASTFVIALALAASAEAQQAAPAEAASVDEVVITGSRVARAGFQAPTPTTVVSPTILNTSASTTVGGVLNNLPSFKADYSPASSGPRTFDSPGATFANLRSLGSVRTLTLLDGRRVVPSSATGQVDLNIIPSALISTIDVVTGGASAAYGSDAVAGVVNIRLRTNLEGFVGNASYSQTSHDDVKDYFFGLGWGARFAGGKGHIMVGGEYDKNKGAGSVYTRDWGRLEYGIMPNPGAGPRNLLVQNYRSSNIFPGGVVQSGPLKGLTFLPNGQTGQFNYGSIVGPSFMSGGEGYGRFYSANMFNPLTRKNLLGRIDYEVSPDLSVYAEASWAKSDSFGRSNPVRDTAPLTVARTYPYLPASVVAQMTALNLTSLAIGRISEDTKLQEINFGVDVMRYAIGGAGSLGGSWKWDAYAQYGRTNYKGDIIGARDIAKFADSRDAVVNPANGQIVCRSTLTAPGNGCVPVNILGSGSPSDAAKAYYLGNEWFRMKYEQSVAAANLRGSPFSTWAGEVSVAAGAEHRREKAVGKSDPVSAVSGWQTGNSRPIAGKVNVTEGYLEAVTPLLKDSPVAKLFELDTAVRFTHYSTSGNVATWKVGVNWELNDQIRFRGTRSRDIRAANITELFSQGVEANNPIQHPVTKISNSIKVLTTGNADLKPEKADTTTLGVVLKPSFLSGLDLSLDYYTIKLNRAIASLTGQQVVDQCFGATPSLCQYVQINQATNTITNVTRATVNIASIKVQGWDFEARYRTGLGSLAPGNLTFQVLATRLNKLEVNDLITTVNYAGDVGSSARSAYGQPKWRGTLLGTYDVGPFSTTATVRYIGKGNINNTWTEADIADNSVASRTYLDWQLQYDVLAGRGGGGKSAQLYLIVQNLFDKDPPPVPTQVSPTNPVIYDVFGRTYRAGVRFNF